MTLIWETMEQEVPEGGLGLLAFEVVDGAGGQVPLASLVTLEMTLYDEATGSLSGGPVINSRSAQSVKNANGGVVTEAGGVTTAVITLGASDNPIVTAGTLWERHRAFFQWTWAGGGPGRKGFILTVRDFSRLP